VKRHLKATLLAAVSGVTRRRAVLLPPEAHGHAGMLGVRAPYRVDGPTLSLEIDEPRAGRLTISFHSRDAKAAWMRTGLAYDGPATLRLVLGNGDVQLGDVALGSVTGGAAVAHRRFSWTLTLNTEAGSLRRRTGHYLARSGAPVGEAYYTGDDYVDYEAESEAVHREIVALASRHGARGPALEVGCATGGTLKALMTGGIDAYGLDYSAWAVERAIARVGADRVWACDVEGEPFPDPLLRRAPFELLVLGSVFEHFRRPYDVLQRLTAVTAPRASMIVLTSNADSLTHRIFGRDWEGYFDWTHHGVDAVTPARLREELPRLGWRIRELRTWHVWDGSDDPTHATLRDWVEADARFRQLLAERELGDFITCVASRA
jgi:2-polyprenyl-3-methyl-5-hydroxy-6-metoxy-1,4-benzoquinol methylase